MLEQFLGCPLIYGLFDLPIATLLNGASPKQIPYEVRDKLGDMLVENAKMWPLANIIVYNTPLQHRTGISSVFDIWWESVVSNYAADCGKKAHQDSMVHSTLNLTTATTEQKQRVLPVRYPKEKLSPAAVFMVTNSTTEFSFSE